MSMKRLAAGMLIIPALISQPAWAEAGSTFSQRGLASYYGDKFQGRKTASGERYRHSGYTAAHKRLPFGTRVRVTHLKTGKSVLVRINDRGPHLKGRIIDLSRRAARALGVLKKGIAPVRIEVVELPDAA